MPEGLLRAVLAGVVGLDEPVALEPLERRVHLAGVQRPHLAGAGLELLAQLQPVLGSLAQQGQQRMADRHALFLGIILGMLLHKQGGRNWSHGEGWPRAHSALPSCTRRRLQDLGPRLRTDPAGRSLRHESNSGTDGAFAALNLLSAPRCPKIRSRSSARSMVLDSSSTCRTRCRSPATASRSPVPRSTWCDPLIDPR